jgi:hypothetical protein
VTWGNCTTTNSGHVCSFKLVVTSQNLAFYAIAFSPSFLFYFSSLCFIIVNQLVIIMENVGIASLFFLFFFLVIFVMNKLLIIGAMVR